MTYKFNVGQLVEFQAPNNEVGLFTIVKQMPEEPRTPDLRYRIKSEGEGFERNVFEYQLSGDVAPKASYARAGTLKRER